MRVRIEVRDAPHIWGVGEIRDAGERRLFVGLGRIEPFVKPYICGTGEMSTEISDAYKGRWEITIDNRDACMWRWAMMS